MNAASPSTTLTVEGLTPASLGLELFEMARHREVALSDARGCADTLRFFHPNLTRFELRAARRVAIDLIQSHSRRLDAACRAALTRAETVAEHATGDEAHAALAEISDLLAAALVGGTAPS